MKTYYFTTIINKGLVRYVVRVWSKSCARFCV